MQSPFPGIDPYLEASGRWPDFHHRFISEICDRLTERLPSHYEAVVDEWIFLSDPSGEPEKQIKPDVAVVSGQPRGRVSMTSGTAGTIAPVKVPLAYTDTERQGFVEILHVPDKSLVTVVEVLSPTNKVGEGRGEYLAKRDAVLTRPVHLVELDLLYGGKRLPMRERLPSAHYYAIVSRAEQRPDADVYPWTVRDPLPPVPIPLRAEDGEIMLDLPAAYRTTFERRRYARSLSYDAALPMRFDEETLSWAMGLAKGVRR